MKKRRINSTDKNLKLIQTNLKLQEEINELKKNTVAQEKYQNLQEQNTSLRERVETLRQEAANLKKELENANFQCNIASAKVTRLEDELNKSNKDKESLENTIKQLNSKNLEFLQKIKTFNNDENKRSSEIIILKKNIQSYIEQISLQKSIHNKDLSKLYEEINRLKEEIKNLEFKIDELKKLETRNNNLVNNNKTSKSQIESLNNKHQSTLNDLKKTKGVLEELQNEINKLKSQLSENSNFVQYHKSIVYSIYNASRGALKDIANKDKFYNCLYEFYSHYLFLINIKSSNNNYLDDISKTKEAYEILSKINTLYKGNFLNDFYQQLDNYGINIKYSIQYIEVNSVDNNISLTRTDHHHIMYEYGSNNEYYFDNIYYYISIDDTISEKGIIHKYQLNEYQSKSIIIDNLFNKKNILEFLENTGSSFEIDGKDQNLTSKITDKIITNIIENKQLFLRIYYCMVLNKNFNKKKDNEKKDFYLSLIYSLVIKNKDDISVVFFNNIKAMEGQNIDEDIYKEISIDDLSIVFMNFFKLISFVYKKIHNKDEKCEIKNNGFIGFSIESDKDPKRLINWIDNDNNKYNITITLCSDSYILGNGDLIKYNNINPRKKMSLKNINPNTIKTKKPLFIKKIKENIRVLKSLLQNVQQNNEFLKKFNNIISKYPTLSKLENNDSNEDQFFNFLFLGILQYNNQDLKNFIIDIRSFITKHNIFCDFGENFKDDTNNQINNYITEENKLKQGATIDEGNIHEILAGMMHKILILIFNKNNTNDFVIDKINELKEIIKNNNNICLPGESDGTFNLNSALSLVGEKANNPITINKNY